MNCLYQTKRISKLKEKMLSSKLYSSIEKTQIIKHIYKKKNN